MMLRPKSSGCSTKRRHGKGATVSAAAAAAAAGAGALLFLLFATASTMASSEHLETKSSQRPFFRSTTFSSSSSNIHFGTNSKEAVTVESYDDTIKSAASAESADYKQEHDENIDNFWKDILGNDEEQVSQVVNRVLDSYHHRRRRHHRHLQENTASTTTRFPPLLPCNQVLDTLTVDELREDISSWIDSVTEPGSFDSFVLSAFFLNNLQYGVQIRRVCASCSEFLSLHGDDDGVNIGNNSSNSIKYQEFCGPSVYGHNATFSGLLVIPTVPIDEDVDEEFLVQGDGDSSSSSSSSIRQKIAPGTHRAYINSRATIVLRRDLPSLQYMSRSDATISALTFLSMASSRSLVVINPDYMGYGNSAIQPDNPNEINLSSIDTTTGTYIGYAVRKSYETSFAPLWWKTQQIIKEDSICQESALANAAILDGYSEGGYAATAVANLLRHAPSLYQLPYDHDINDDETIDQSSSRNTNQDTVTIIQLRLGGTPLSLSIQSLFHTFEQALNDNIPVSRAIFFLLWGSSFSSTFPYVSNYQQGQDFLNTQPRRQFSFNGNDNSTTISHSMINITLGNGDVIVIDENTTPRDVFINAVHNPNVTFQDIETLVEAVTNVTTTTTTTTTTTDTITNETTTTTTVTATTKDDLLLLLDPTLVALGKEILQRVNSTTAGVRAIERINAWSVCSLYNQTELAELDLNFLCQALEENDLTRLVTDEEIVDYPVDLCYSRNDEVISYAANILQPNLPRSNSKHVTLFRTDPAENHLDTAGTCFFRNYQYIFTDPEVVSATVVDIHSTTRSPTTCTTTTPSSSSSPAAPTSAPDDMSMPDNFVTTTLPTSSPTMMMSTGNDDENDTSSSSTSNSCSSSYSLVILVSLLLFLNLQYYLLSW